MLLLLVQIIDYVYFQCWSINQILHGKFEVELKQRLVTELNESLFQ